MKKKLSTYIIGSLLIAGIGVLWSRMGLLDVPAVAKALLNSRHLTVESLESNAEPSSSFNVFGSPDRIYSIRLRVKCDAKTRALLARFIELAEHFPDMQLLDLRDCGFSRDELLNLTHFHDLRLLDVSGNAVDDDIVKLIAQSSPKLRGIGLVNTRVSSVSLGRLANLRTVWVSENEFLTHAEIVKLAETNRAIKVVSSVSVGPYSMPGDEFVYTPFQRD